MNDKFFLKVLTLFQMNEHNYRLFNNIQTHIDKLLKKVKFDLLWWLKANNVTLVYNSHKWWSDPLLCF